MMPCAHPTTVTTLNVIEPGRTELRGFFSSTPQARMGLWTRRQHPGHREGTVTTGAAGACPVSASENRIIRNVKVRLLAISLSSIQYQWPL
jgi:hypothetical protein